MFSPLELIWFIIISLYFFFDFLLYLSVLSINTKPSFRKDKLPITVIIAARNEAHRLKVNLHSILNQNYPKFEVLVINDQSNDNTLEILNAFKNKYKNFNFLSVSPSVKSSKKNALDLGIKNAKYEHLVFTDADCKPLSEKWLSLMQRNFFSKCQLVLGFSPYQKKSSYINAIIRFETLMTAINYYGFAKIGIPYMGVGRNLAYTKTLYQKLDGFKSHQDLLSGDDDLLVSKASKHQEIALCLHPNSFMLSEPKEDLASWISQKLRHITTASHYRLRHKLLLSLQYLSKAFFWFLALPLTILLEIKYNVQFYYAGTILLIFILKSILNFKIFKQFLSQDLWSQTYFWELNLVCLQFYIFTRNLVSKKSNW